MGGLRKQQILSLCMGILFASESVLATGQHKLQGQGQGTVTRPHVAQADATPTSLAHTTRRIVARQDDDNKSADDNKSGDDKDSAKDTGAKKSDDDNKSSKGKPKLTDSSSSSSMPSKTSSTITTPVMTVPSMADNPYLTTSKLPEGTVFIAVGAVLGGLAAAVMAWSMFSALSLKRSLKKTDEAEGPLMSTAIDDKGMFYPGDPSRAGDPFSNSNSNLSSDQVVGSRRGGAPPANAPSLFFSPTAEVMNSANSNMAANTNSNYNGSMSSMFNGQRSSAYLPAGYYTPGGTNNPGTTGSMTSRTTRNFSMARESMYGGAPPSVRNSSIGTTRNLSAEPQHQQRAPSAYLDDLLGHEDTHH